MKTALYTVVIVTAFVASSAYGNSVSPEQAASTKRVSTGRLDLSGRHDRAIFDARIRQAAQTICENLNGAYSGVVTECVTHSIKTARPQRDALVEQHVRLADVQRLLGASNRPIG